MDFPVTVHGTAPEPLVKVGTGDDRWWIPVELPIAFVYNRRNYAVMMGTPKDISDFALGFSLTEEIVQTADEIQSLHIYWSGRGAELHFELATKALERINIVHRRRNMVGSASCGICGLDNSDTLFRTLRQVSLEKVALDTLAMQKAMAALPKAQAINAKTRSVHAAAWADHQGNIKLVREDVGRHNALDKLVGAMIADQINIGDGFILMSSRCSYEIVEKAARAGVQAIVAISGPTSFALKKATEANMSIYARDGDDMKRLS